MGRRVMPAHSRAPTPVHFASALQTSLHCVTRRSFGQRNKQRFDATPRVEVSPRFKMTGARCYYVTQRCSCLFRFVRPVFRLFIHARRFLLRCRGKENISNFLERIFTYLGTIVSMKTSLTYSWPGIRGSDLAGCLPGIIITHVGRYQSQSSAA